MRVNEATNDEHHPLLFAEHHHSNELAGPNVLILNGREQFQLEPEGGFVLQQSGLLISEQQARNNCDCSCNCNTTSARQPTTSGSSPLSNVQYCWLQFKQGPPKMETKQMSSYVNIRTLGVLLFILASCYCVYSIINLSYEKKWRPGDFDYTTELKLVSVFGRHGDRKYASWILPMQDRVCQFSKTVRY